MDPLDDETLQKRLSNRRGVFGYTPLHEAVSGKMHLVIPYLCEKKADINARANSGYTPLHLAASAGDADCCRTLIRYGADFTLTDDYGKTPKQAGNSTIVRLLKSEGEY